MSWESVLPLRITSKVVRGFGRGASDLGIPTANLCPDEAKLQSVSLSIPPETNESMSPSSTSQSKTTTATKGVSHFDDLPCGIYWGFCRIGDNTYNSDKNDNNKNKNPLGDTYTTAVSIGYNPTYGNAHKTVEPHLIAPASDPRRHSSSTGETLLQDFYDQPVRLSVLGYLRPELPFEGLEKLIQAIKQDILQAEALAQQDTIINVRERAWVTSNQPLNGNIHDKSKLNHNQTNGDHTHNNSDPN